MLTAADGEDGLRVAREQRPDAITLDVMMPGMDGWTVLSRLMADPELGDIPVIMLTIVDDKRRGYTLGALDYLTKPIDRARLVAVLTKYRRDLPVLVVDDDAGIRQLLRRILEEEGYMVVEAENGRVALERLGERVPGAILLDLMMPEMDGFEFLERTARARSVAADPGGDRHGQGLDSRGARAAQRLGSSDPAERGVRSTRAAGRGADASGRLDRPPEEGTPMTKILLVEDNEMNRDMLSRRLQKQGYEVVLAVDGEEGLAKAQSDSPALILMDMSLPGVDGWEATRRLKAAPQTQKIPIIALTAHAMTDDRDKALAAGCDDFDTKPVELPRLLSKIQALLGRHAP